MKQPFLMDGNAHAWRVQGGSAYVYATLLHAGMPVGRRLLYRVVADGEVLVPVSPVRVEDASWGCLVVLGADADTVLLEEPVDTKQAQRLFTSFVQTAFAAKTADDAAELCSSKAAAQDAYARAYGRLRDVNKRIGAWEDDSLRDDDELVAACQVLGKYLCMEIIVPNTEGTEDERVFQIFRHSGIRYKAVQLDGRWWKRNSGAMMGTLEDGTPVALLPHGMRGYKLYNPKTQTTVVVNDSIGHTVCTLATAVYRSFPAEPMRFGKLLHFCFGEHIYLEVGIILLFSFFASLIQVLPPILSEQVFDIIVPEYLRGMLAEVIMILLAFEIAGIGFSVLVNLGFARLKNKIELSLQAGIWDRLVSLRIPFFQQFTSGELLEKIKGIGTIKDTLSLDLLKTLLSALFSFINIIVMFHYNAAITPSVLLLFLVFFLIFFEVCRRKYKLNRRYIAVAGQATTMNQQLLDGVKRLKASRAEARAWAIWSTYEDNLRYLQGRIKRLDILLDSVTVFFRFGAIAFVYLLISQQSNVEMGTFVAYIASYLIFQKAMMNLMKVVRVVPELVPTMKNLAPILQAVPERTVDRKAPNALDGSISLDHAGFQYGTYGNEILKDVSLHVKPGESIGIIGSSGSGKSTLLGLMLGLRSPTSGRVYMGGYDMESVNLEMLRMQIGVVLQHGALRVGSIYSNLAGRNQDVTADDMMEALHLVGLKEIISALPEGLHTTLEARADLFSQGQMQQLMIARAIVSRPRYLIMDEATSHLDNITQDRVMQALRDLPATKIFIAQRKSSIRYCDRVVTVRNGHVETLCDAGKHDSVGRVG